MRKRWSVLTTVLPAGWNGAAQVLQAEPVAAFRCQFISPAGTRLS